MKNKMSKTHAVKYIVHGVPKGQPNPSKLLIKIMKNFNKDKNNDLELQNCLILFVVQRQSTL